MKRTTKWGIWGALLLFCFGMLCILIPYGSMFCETAHRVQNVVFYPVRALWMGVFKVLGLEGDSGMIFGLPILASIILYLTALGFGVGAFLGKITKQQ